ncbi:MAG TPA: molybdopterin-dependent oxidoreductase, partial [Armatimonadota bacterium]|nr:molybdopterin-dependent oxidoreductase [Armatimonadota bacterium]
MEWKKITNGALLGALTGIPVILLASIAERVAGLPFVPFVLFDFMVRVLPGFILIPGIHILTVILLALHVASLSAAAKLAEQATALVLFLAMGGFAGSVLGGFAILRRGRHLPLTGALLGLTGMAGIAIIRTLPGFPPADASSLLWTGFLLIVWGIAIGWLLRVIYSPKPEVRPIRGIRLQTTRMAGILAVLLLVAGAGLVILKSARGIPGSTAPPIPPQPGVTAGPAASPSAETLARRIEPAPGARPEITAVKDFYRIDIDTDPPRVNASKWRLEINGLVARPMKLSLDDIRARAPVSQYATMCCISNPVGGPLISTGLWTGVTLISILKEAGVKPPGTRVTVESADGYYETVSPGDMTDPRTLLTYALNGEPLTPEQGFPLRLYIPNRYGMKSPKWITRITVIQEDGRGYWVDRGWDAAAVVQTMSVIDVVAVDHPDPLTGTVPMGGIAFAGDRGVSRVEVQIDEGPWVRAALRSPPLSPLAWMQWRYDWPSVPGKHK